MGKRIVKVGKHHKIVHRNKKGRRWVWSENANKQYLKKGKHYKGWNTK